MAALRKPTLTTPQGVKIFEYDLQTTDDNKIHDYAELGVIQQVAGIQPVNFCMQLKVGTQGGAQVKLVGSNDGTNFFTLTDQHGVALELLTADGLFDGSTSARYIGIECANATNSTDFQVKIAYREG